MVDSIEESYFVWLYDLVGSTRNKNPKRTHWNLMRYLHKREFVWIVPNDDNRAEDGRDLRGFFIDEKGIDRVDPDWLSLGCSIFEMLIGISKRLSFEDDRDPVVWFGELLGNLKLLGCTDDKSLPVKRVDEVVDKVIWRTYDSNGKGGLFPLKNPTQDQRKVELWYQLCAYLLDED